MGDKILHLSQTASIKASMFYLLSRHFLYIHEAVVCLVMVVVQQIIR